MSLSVPSLEFGEELTHHGTGLILTSGDKYHGKWQCDHAAGVCMGNPALLAEASDVMTAIKWKTSSEGANQNHSSPMTWEYMQRTLAWSQENCALQSTFQYVLLHMEGWPCQEPTVEEHTPIT